METVTPILQGVTTDLSGLGPNVTAGINVFLPYFLLAAGIGLAIIVLRSGMGFLKSAGGRK